MAQALLPAVGVAPASRGDHLAPARDQEEENAAIRRGPGTGERRSRGPAPARLGCGAAGEGHGAGLEAVRGVGDTGQGVGRGPSSVHPRGPGAQGSRDERVVLGASSRARFDSSARLVVSTRPASNACRTTPRAGSQLCPFWKRPVLSLARQRSTTSTTMGGRSGVHFRMGSGSLWTTCKHAGVVSASKGLRRSASRRGRRRPKRCRSAHPPGRPALAGRHVVGRAEHDAGWVMSEPPRRARRNPRLDLAVRLDLDVRGLQVAVHDLLGVSERQPRRPCSITCSLSSRVVRRLGADDGAQVLALQAVHRHVPSPWSSPRSCTVTMLGWARWPAAGPRAGTSRFDSSFRPGLAAIVLMATTRFSAGPAPCTPCPWSLARSRRDLVLPDPLELHGAGPRRAGGWVPMSAARAQSPVDVTDLATSGQASGRGTFGRGIGTRTELLQHLVGNRCREQPTGPCPPSPVVSRCPEILVPQDVREPFVFL